MDGSERLKRAEMGGVRSASGSGRGQEEGGLFTGRGT